MTGEAEKRALASIRRHLVAIAMVIAVFAGGLGAWSAGTEISGAVIASGVLVVDSKIKKVQHLYGGVVAEIRVRDGDRVKAGQLLLRLDETVLAANLAVVRKGLNELAARQARLESERDAADEFRMSGALASRAADTDLQAAIASERVLFEMRRKVRFGQRAQLAQRIAQIEEEVRGLIWQSVSKTREIALITRELEGVRSLYQKSLVPLTRLNQLERDATRLEGERGQLVANAAHGKGRIAETELQILQIEQDLRSEVAKELRDTQAKIAELEERRVAAEDQLKRTEVRAPVDGVIHQMTVHTVGGVIRAGEEVMLIVPDSDALAVEVKLSPQDIDQVRVGQAVLLRIAAVNHATTPELNGSVSLVSPDLVTDSRSGIGYYAVRVALPPGEITRLGGIKLVPGMPVDAHVQTEPRTIASYLLRPFRDQLARAFREK